jgi:hypothetical protein
MRTLTQLQAKQAHQLSRDEWMTLALAGQLTPEHLQWRSQVAELEHMLSSPHELMLQAVEEGHQPSDVLFGAILCMQDLKAPRVKTPAAIDTKILQVHKFNPGQHFHVLDTKFDTLDEAIRHLEANGYQYGGLQEKYWPATDGD